MLFKNLKSLFIAEEKKEVPSKLTSVLPDDELVQDILDEFKGIDDFDAQLSAALEGEFIDAEGAVDKEIIESLLKEVGVNNLDGFDYFEYKQSLKALDKMQMDEATKYRSAFATAFTIGATLKILLESADFYLGILDREENKFKEKSDQEKKNNVSKKETKINSLSNRIQEKKDNIKRLKEEITKEENRIIELKREVKIDKVQIEKKRNNFIVSFNYLRSQFVDDIAKMKKYLK